MSDIDLDHLRAWVGKSHADEDVISSRHARLMAATVDHPDPERIRNGERPPPLWHRIYFLAGLPSAELGRDGHPARGGFLPPVPLPNRMWAGGRVSFVQPLLIGSAVRKESSILSVDHKRGRSGDLVFVTVLHQVKSLAGELLIREEHDIVYKGATSAPQQAENPASAHHGPPAKAFTPTSTTLFRYSALTCNGHRIHYDYGLLPRDRGLPQSGHSRPADRNNAGHARGGGQRPCRSGIQLPRHGASDPWRLARTPCR